jgi:hypothetical protein
MKTYEGSRYIGSQLLTSTLDGDQMSTSLSDRFTLGECIPVRLHGIKSSPASGGEEEVPASARNQAPVFQPMSITVLLQLS